MSANDWFMMGLSWYAFAEMLVFWGTKKLAPKIDLTGAGMKLPRGALHV